MPFTTPAKSANNFDIIRFVLASLVIFSHAWPMVTGGESSEPLMRLSHGQMTLGTLAVDCFFVISGYLIAGSWSHRPQIASYLSKRIRRVYPGYLVASALSALAVAPLFSDTRLELWGVRYYAVNAIQLIGVQPMQAFMDNPYPGPVNGSLWTIPYEFWCYIGLMCAGVCGLVGRRVVLAAALAGLVAVSYLAAWAGNQGGWIAAYDESWSRLLPNFVAGMLLQSFGRRFEWSAKGAGVALLLLLVGCVMPHGLRLAIPTAGAYLLLWLAFAPLGRHASAAFRHDYSYGIYLYAFPIGQLIVHFMHPISPFGLFAIVWPLAVLAGAISWHVVEAPFMRTTRASPIAPISRFAA